MTEYLLPILEKMGSGFLALLAVIGCADLAKTLLSRFFSKKDKKTEIDILNQGKQIEADEKFTETILKRLDKLETEQKEMQEKLLSQAISNAKLETENKNLIENKERQEKEIEALRETNRGQAKEISTLRTELHETTAKLTLALKNIEELSTKITNVEHIQKKD